MNKILVIEESSFFREYLKQKLEKYNFEVLLATNGLDGMIKLRNTLPDLVIMDYYLSRKSCMEILQEKQKNPNIALTPLILTCSKINRKRLMAIAKYNINKIFPKPIKIDSMLMTISKILGVKMDFDSTPCIIEAHINTNILLIEIAQGLNWEKIELLKYKISELLSIYKIKAPNVLIIMSDITPACMDEQKLETLLHDILKYSNTQPKAVKILTQSILIRDFIAGHKDFKKIITTDTLEKAMDKLMGIKVTEFGDAGKSMVKEDFLVSEGAHKDESIHLKFETEKAEEKEETGLETRLKTKEEAEKKETSPINLENLGKKIIISVVDDDIVTRELIRSVFSKTGWEIKTHENGKIFIESLTGYSPDLIFLDLMMPEMNGFQVMKYLKQSNIQIPVIVLSVLSNKENVIRALSYGVHSYMIKPLMPERILKKTSAILAVNF